MRSTVKTLFNFFLKRRQKKKTFFKRKRHSLRFTNINCIFTHIKKNTLNQYNKYIVFCNFQYVLINRDLIKSTNFLEILQFFIENSKYIYICEPNSFLKHISSCNGGSI